ncbi:hypothetical protein [Lysinibacillus sp. CTST325]
MKAKRQQQGFICAKAERQRQQYEVGHEELSQDIAPLHGSSVTLILKKSPRLHYRQLQKKTVVKVYLSL